VSGEPLRFAQGSGQNIQDLIRRGDPSPTEKSVRRAVRRFVTMLTGRR
jgi:hypothetical protein